MVVPKKSLLQWQGNIPANSFRRCSFQPSCYYLSMYLCSWIFSFKGFILEGNVRT